MPDRQYTDEEVRAIIDRALASEPERGISHEQLLAIGADVGISRNAIEDAAREVSGARQLALARERIIRRRRKRFASHAWAYAIVNVFLFVVNYLTTPGEWWVLFPVLTWGMGLAFHARADLSKDVSERRLARELERMQREAPTSVLARSSYAKSPQRLRVGSAAKTAPASLEPDAAADEERDAQRASSTPSRG